MIYCCLLHNSVLSLPVILQHYQKSPNDSVDFVSLVEAASKEKCGQPVTSVLFAFLTSEVVTFSKEQKLQLISVVCEFSAKFEESETFTNFVKRLLEDLESLPITCLKLAIKAEKCLLVDLFLDKYCYLAANCISVSAESAKESGPGDEKELPSLLQVVLQAKSNAVLKQLLDKTDLDVRELSAEGDTCIHLAVRLSNDLAIMETLLLRLRTLLPKERDLQEFLNKKNQDQLSALDYCVFKNRHDIKVMLEEFVSSNHQIFELKDFTISHTYRLKDFAGTKEFTTIGSLQTACQF